MASLSVATWAAGENSTLPMFCWSLVPPVANNRFHCSHFQQRVAIGSGERPEGFTQQVQHVIESIAKREASEITTVELGGIIPKPPTCFKTKRCRVATRRNYTMSQEVPECLCPARWHCRTPSEITALWPYCSKPTQPLISRVRKGQNLAYWRSIGRECISMPGSRDWPVNTA